MSQSSPTDHQQQQQQHATSPGQSSTNPSSSAELASLKTCLRAALRQFPDFPSPGILFEDFLPIFINPSLHDDLVRALQLHIQQQQQQPDVIVGLEARGFLFGPTLALRLGASFVPARKKGKLPGPCETQGFSKEYGEDFFQMQAGSIKPGQKVIVVDDVIATGVYILNVTHPIFAFADFLNTIGGSAYAAGELVKKQGGQLLGYIFVLELDFLKGRAKLTAPVYTLLSGQDGKDRK